MPITPQDPTDHPAHNTRTMAHEAMAPERADESTSNVLMKQDSKVHIYFLQFIT